MKTRTAAKIGFLCLATLMMVCAEVQAQGGRGGGRGGFGRGGFGRGGALAFIQRDDVQGELNLTEAQIGQIEVVVDELREAGGGGRGGFGGIDFQNASPEEIQEAIAERRAEQQKQQDEALAKVKEVLNANQTKRYGELELQYAIHEMKDNDQLKVLAAYLDDAKIEAATGEPFEFEQQTFGGFGRGGRGGGAGRGGRGGGGRGGAGAGGNDAGGDDAPSRRRRGDE